MTNKNKDKYPRLETMKLAEIQKRDHPRRVIQEAPHHARISLEEFGLLQPPVFNVRTKRLLSLETIVDALRDAGAEEVEVWQVDLTEEQEIAASLALNSHWNEFWWEKVAAELKQVVKAGLPLTLTGLPECDTGPLLAADWSPPGKAPLDDVHVDPKQGGLF
jgi:hypothetical protein